MLTLYTLGQKTEYILWGFQCYLKVEVNFIHFFHSKNATQLGNLSPSWPTFSNPAHVTVLLALCLSFCFFFSFPHYNPPEPKLLVGHISCTAYTCTSFLCPCIVFLWKLQFLCLYNEHSHILQNNIIHGILGDVFILN